MGCRGGSKTRIHPRNHQNIFVRVNGLTRPIHYLQVVAWTILLLFLLLYFGVVAPAVEMPWKPAAFVCVGLIYLFHMVVHIIATTKNPADANAKSQMKQNHQMPQYDRSKHAHVIENEYCHLCETYVSKNSKHCRACNKCVMDFDHHCLWLNNCVGGVNYRYFLSTIASAFLGTLVIAAVTLFVFINSFLDFQSLDQDVWWKATSPVAFQVLMAILIVLCLICSILLGQLLFFHLFLIRGGITTYEYIQNSRAKKKDDQNSGSPAGEATVGDTAACSTPPTIVNTAVTTTSEGKAVVEVSKTHTEYLEKRNSEDTANGHARKSEEMHSKSEFTNAAFSAEEPKNVNSNSSVRVPTPSQLSLNGSISHASSLGELRPWADATDPLPVIIAPGSPRNSASGGTLNGSVMSDTAQARDRLHQLHPSSGMPENATRRTRGGKRKRSTKKPLLIGSDDGLPRPLPVLPEHSNPPLSHSTLRKKTVLPPLRNSADWASSSEDLHSIISSQRKLPSITPSSSVNSFASYASGSVISNHRVG